MESRTKYCRIFKIFGDLEAKNYTTFKNKFDSKEKSLKDFLDTSLAKNILVIGFDPDWDEPIERLFPGYTDDIWYVNEQLLVPGSLLYKAVERRKGKYLDDQPRSYREFIQALHGQLMNTD